MSGDLGEVEESVVARRSSITARLIVGVCLAIGLFAAGQWLMGRDDDAQTIEDQTADVAQPTTALTTTSVFAATTQPEETLETIDSPAPLGVTIVADVAELALGAPEGTRVAYGTMDGGLRVVDLSNGTSFDVGTVFPLAITANYLLGSETNLRQVSTGATTLVIIDLVTLAVDTFQMETEVVDTVPTGDPDRIWLLNASPDGQSPYQLFDLRDGGTLLDRLDTPVWSWMVSGGDRNQPFLNVLTNGVYLVDGTNLSFLGAGTVAAASAGGAIWKTCDDSFICSTQLVTDDGSIELEIDIGELFVDPSVRVSPSARFVAWIDVDLEGVTVVEVATGISTQFEVGHIWSADGLVFVDHRLLVWSEATLKIIDTRSGEITHLKTTPNLEYLVSSQ